MLVSLDRFECHFLRKLVCLICRVRRGPIHGLLERFHRLGGQLDVAFARLTVFQLLDVVRLQSETVEVGKLRRIAEFSNCEIAGKFAKRINVRSELEIFFRSRLNIDGAEYKHLIWSAGFHYFRNRFSVSDRRNLIFFQPNIIAEEFEWLDVLRIRGRKLDKGKQKQDEDHSWESDSN